MAHDFEQLLAQHIGLDSESVGRDLIARAVEERRRNSGAPDREAYWELVTRSAAELQALIEAVTVSETWFFRDSEAFALLVREATGPWLAAHAQGMLRVLSLPCATGEEPYSIVMALLDGGFPVERLAIDAIDISERALARARRGVYGNNAFRSRDSSFRQRHFDPLPDGFRLRDACRAPVSFRSGNLLSADVTLGAMSYDAILCRNVLIYLDRPAQRRALDVLVQLLSPAGLLFVGPSETSLLSPHEFTPLRVPLAFAFRKLPRVERAPTPLAAVRPAVSRRTRTPRGAAAVRAPNVPEAMPVRAAHGQAPIVYAAGLDADAHLELATSLADRGQLSEAYRLCAEHERLHGPSARLFYLMGLLREAAHELEDAASFHKKALYLDPNHGDALLHLALLLERSGDRVGADRLRQRAQRRSKEGR